MISWGQHAPGRRNNMFNRRLLVSTSRGGSDPVPELPDQDTLLLDDFGPGTVTIKIPEGCNVVKVNFDVYLDYEGFVQIDVLSVKTGVRWLEVDGYQEIIGDRYIGVTSGAEYTLSIMTNSETGTETVYLSIYYSKYINTITPKKTDYIK